MENHASKTILLKDSEWNVIDGELCRVTDFATLGSYVDIDGNVHAMDRTTPYANITMECRKLGKNISGYITHKDDFRHLWTAFKDRKVNENEEVIIIWTRKHYKANSWIGRKVFYHFSTGLPKLRVMVFHKGAFELLNDPDYRPELSSESRWNLLKPIIEWKPEVMR